MTAGTAEAVAMTGPAGIAAVTEGMTAGFTGARAAVFSVNCLPKKVDV
jgi:hypothetical protein